MKPWRTLVSILTAAVLGLILGFLLEQRWSSSEPRALVLHEDAACAKADHTASGYYREASKICYSGWATPIDPGSFQELGSGFAADAAYIYFQGSPVSGARPETFAIPEYQSNDPSAGVYAKDAERVFSACPDCNPPYGLVQSLEAADPSTFVVLSRPGAAVGYAKDRDQVWLFGVPVTGADAVSFQLVPAGGAYDSVDARNGYWRGELVAPKSP